MTTWLLLGLALMSAKDDLDLKSCQEKLKKCTENVEHLRKKIEAFQEELERRKPKHPPPTDKKT